MRATSGFAKEQRQETLKPRQHLAGGTPLFVMDVFEHAFLTDYGIKRADYLAAFWANVDWAKVEARIG